MPGTPSDPGRPVRAFDPPSTRAGIRITNIYGTSWEPVEHLEHAQPLTSRLRFGRLAGYYDNAADQLPTVAGCAELDPTTLAFHRWVPGTSVLAGRLWTLVMPSGQAVVALTLDVTATPMQAIDLLEDCYYLDIQVGDENLERFATRQATSLGMTDADRHGLAPERHQLVLLSSLAEQDRDDVVQKLIYRANLPYRPEYSAITYPAELNRRPNATVAVGPYVSVLAGQQDYVENAAFLSAAQAVASAVRLREIRDLAYEDVRLYRDAQATMPDVRTRRHTLERMVNQLGNLELELSFSVEAPSDLGLLVPSLRVVAYHDALFGCMGLREKADLVARTLHRLERSIHAETTAVEILERRADENRRARWGVAVGFLSTVALPVTLVLTFFGINARQVNGDLSMFDRHYLPMYAAVAVLLILGLTLSAGLYLQQRRQAVRDARRATQAMAAVRSMTVAPRRPPHSNPHTTVMGDDGLPPLPCQASSRQATR